jgi:hypothetical protein
MSDEEKKKSEIDDVIMALEAEVAGLQAAAKAAPATRRDVLAQSASAVQAELEAARLQRRQSKPLAAIRAIATRQLDEAHCKAQPLQAEFDCTTKLLEDLQQRLLRWTQKRELARQTITEADAKAAAELAACPQTPEDEEQALLRRLEYLRQKKQASTATAVQPPPAQLALPTPGTPVGTLMASVANRHRLGEPFREEPEASRARWSSPGKATTLATARRTAAA